MIGDTQVSIINLGLGHISQRPITSISDTNSVQAVVANRIWTPAVGEALRANDWAFARAIALLVESATYDPSVYNYLYAYVMPSNCLALRSIFNSFTKNRTLGEKYERMYDQSAGAELILTNLGGTTAEEYAYGRFTYNVTDVTKWDASFVTSISYLLAAKMAPVLLGTGAKEIANMIQLYNNSISDSQRIDSYEGSTDTDSGNPIVESRG